MERLWTKSFIQMTFAMLFLFTGFYLLVPTLPIFIKEIGGNESQVGLMMGMFTIAAVVVRPIIGGYWINMVEDPLLFSDSSFWVNDVLL